MSHDPEFLLPGAGGHKVPGTDQRAWESRPREYRTDAPLRRQTGDSREKPVEAALYGLLLEAVGRTSDRAR